MTLPTVQIFQTFEMKEKVALSGRYLNKHLRESVGNELKNALEGVCSRHGYIRPGSVKVLSIGPGVVAMENRGSTTFSVDFEAEVCNPLLDSVITCRVESSNNMAALVVNVGEPRVLEVLVPAESKLYDHEAPFETLKVGSSASIRVKGKKFLLGQRTIVCTGQIVAVQRTDPHTVASEDPMDPMETNDPAEHADNIGEELDEAGTEESDTEDEGAEQELAIEDEEEDAVEGADADDGADEESV